MGCLLAFRFEPSIHLPAGGRSSISPFFLAFCKGLCYTFCRTEQKTAGAFRHFAPPGGGRNVKREAGADPARSRHCDKGVRIRVLCTSHWSFCSGKEMTGGDLSVRKPACCWYGGANPRSRGIGCTKKPVRYGVFLLCHFASKRPRFFRYTLGSLSCTLLFGAVFYPHQERKTR